MLYRLAATFLGATVWRLGACTAADSHSLGTEAARRVLASPAMAVAAGGWPGRAAAGVRAWLAAGASGGRGAGWAGGRRLG